MTMADHTVDALVITSIGLMSINGEERRAIVLEGGEEAIKRAAMFYGRAVMIVPVDLASDAQTAHSERGIGND